jgi:hypothetical protein
MGLNRKSFFTGHVFEGIDIERLSDTAARADINTVFFVHG